MNIEYGVSDSDIEDTDFKVEDHQETDESQEDDDDHQNNNAMNIKVDIDQEQEDKRITEIWHGIRDSKKNERQIPIIQSYLKTLNNTKTLNFEFAGQSFSTYASNFLDLDRPVVQEEDEELDKSLVPKTINKHPFRKSKLQRLSLKYGVAENIRLNTLEKSKLDWQKFVKDEGLADELRLKNKDGYLERVGFLQRIDERQDDIVSSLNKLRKRN